SFLDIVANLVGILIILVMVIGARATDAMVSAVPKDAIVEDSPKIDVEASRAAAAAVENDIHEIDAKIKRQDVEIAYRRKERDKMMQVLAVVEDQLKSRTSALDADQQKRLETTRDLIAARSELEDLKASLHALENATPPQNVIEHLPTPMAQTVFGREVHFRLQGGRIAYVPWDELVEKLKEDAPHNVWKLKDVPRITETLGPVKGFRMKYTLQQAQQVTPMGGGMAVQRRIELDRFVLVPVRDDLGEPLDIALGEVSQFRTILSDFEPNRTTVTFWVYPDSFDQFRRVKADLFRRGYSTAGRPMPEGHPIGGSPNGSRSAAE
ncbi:MAG: hypothetical protein JJ992_00510, partial [Planctomycetes bacterium]|nr:hypothetical protein [Planctomycetota bacterium]